MSSRLRAHQLARMQVPPRLGLLSYLVALKFTSPAVLHLSSFWYLLPSTTATTLILHANSWIRRLGELLLRLLLSARRVAALSRMSAGALLCRPIACQLSSPFERASQLPPQQRVARKRVQVDSQIGIVQQGAQANRCTYFSPSLRLLVWTSFLSPFFALSMLCSSSGSMLVSVSSFVDALFG